MKITDQVTRYDHSDSCRGEGGRCFERIVPVVGGDYVLASDYDALAAEVTKLRAELETERMRLAACGVVALANTPESAKAARDMHPDYRSASCDDVARIVDENMKLRADAQELESDLSASAESEGYLADRVDTLTHCILVEIAALEHNQRGSTHWEGCESRHHDCAAIKRMEAAIDAARGAV